MKKLLTAVAVITGLLVIVPGPAIAITDGTPDTGNNYPFVGLLAFRDADGEYMHRCSGTLLTPTIVLTASHCTDGTSAVHAYFSFQVPDDFRTNPVGVPGTPHTNPLYNPNTLANDASVVELSAPVDLATYPVLPTEGLLSDLKRSHEIQDDVFVNVGYGVLNGPLPPIQLNNEDRWFSTSPYGGLNQNNLHLQGNHQATGLGGTCFGDSGGPHFWEDTLVLVSVTSWGDANCRSNDMTQRADIPSVLDWLGDEFGVVAPA
jgi:secreted trypsin-like serine protease